jgi:hypothetical protein
MARAQLGLAHSYSRAKVKFNVNKADNMIIQVGAVGGVEGWVPWVGGRVGAALTPCCCLFAQDDDAC